jgi:hypothetical protein
MIKIALIIVYSWISFGLNASDIRNDFHNNMFNEDELTILTKNKNYPINNLTLAYKGISQTMLADYMFLPTTKLSYFNLGKADLEKAIKKEPKNIEFRYLRLLIQLNAPFFLNYNDQIDNDIDLLTTKLTSYKLNKYWKIKFIDNLLAADELTTQQEKKVKALKIKLI